MSILENEVKTLLDNKVVTLDDIIFYAAKALNSGKDSEEKITLFRAGKRKVVERETIDHCPALTALGYTIAKSKMKLTGQTKLTAVKDVKDLGQVANLINEVSPEGFTFAEMKPSEVNPGYFSIFFIKLFNEA